ncbi:hypothetical protein BAE44_0013901, partial [Dichanthelium oligosanthes]
LEIVSGLKITLTRFTGFPNLLPYRRGAWQDGKAMDLVDLSLVKTCSSTEALWCCASTLDCCVCKTIQIIGHLCHRWCSCWRTKPQRLLSHYSLHVSRNGSWKAK